jgi:threonine dehydratase
MPEHAPIAKVKATRRYGGEVVLHGADYNEAEARAREIEREEDRTYVHAYDDPAVMAGQGTIGLEILEDCPEVETVVVPIGGGGLIAGIATAIKTQRPDVRVVGVEAAGADSAVRSVRAGSVVELDHVDTIADGIATRRLGDRTFEVIRERVDEVVTVSDEEIVVAMTSLLERSKALVEGAGAVALAALLSGAFEFDEGEVVVPALCGGNIDLNTLTTLIVRGLVATGRYLTIRTELKDRPGALADLIDVVAEEGANIYAIRHDRTSRNVAMNAAELELDLETWDHDHVDRVIAALESNGYPVDRRE